MPPTWSTDTPSAERLPDQQELPGARTPTGAARAITVSGPGRTGRHFAARNTQRERILTWALAGRVVHQDDWYNGGADGGSAIKAVRSRICELEADGYRFHHFRRMDGTREYKLAHVPAPPAARAPEPETDDVDAPQLFEPPPSPPAPPLNALTWEGEAA